MAITNLLAFDAAIRAVCPIDGCCTDGTIWFSASATPAQIAAAKTAAANYVDPAPTPGVVVPPPVILAPLPRPKAITEA